MDYQWIHIEAVSKAGRNIYGKINGEKKITGNISVDSVLGEAGRYEGYISHVEEPLNPVILFGDGEKGVEAVRKKVNDWYAWTKDLRGHRIRNDANGLLSGVISWPPPEEGVDKKEYDDRRNAFELSMLEWLKKKYGDDLVLVLRHDDEPFRGLHAGKTHYHWHFFCVKKPGQKFDLHPGFLARSEFNVSRQNRKDMSHEELKAVNKEGMKAYKNEMIEFQDNFFLELGRRHGLNRLGPMRLRRSRGEEKDVKAVVELDLAYPKKVMEEAICKKAEAEVMQADAEKIKAGAEEIELAAENKAESFIKDAKSEVQGMKAEANAMWAEAERKKKESEKIKMETANEAERVKTDANSEAKVIIDKAWLTAKDITDTAQNQADSIIGKAKSFVNLLLGEVSKLPGGDAVVKWAKTFIKPLVKPRTQPGTTVKGNKKSDSHKGRPPH